MSIQESPNRVVRTKDSVIAFIGHKLETDGDILIEMFVDAQTNVVSFKSMSKARKGKDFVEANESVQPLIDFTNSLIQQQEEAANVPTVNEDDLAQTPAIGTGANPVPIETPEWVKLKFPNKLAWKDWLNAGKPVDAEGKPIKA